MKKTALVLGAGGFIGGHLVKQLRSDGFWVGGADLKRNEFSDGTADDFQVGDLRNPIFCEQLFDQEFDEVYQLAADMGGAGYIFTGEHDADVMHNSALINLNISKLAVEKKAKSLFYSSSACMYPEYNQMDPDNPKCNEDSAYPAAPDSGMGGKIDERLYLSFHRNYGLPVKIARFHNIFGIEKAPGVVEKKKPPQHYTKRHETPNGGTIEVWGDGLQTRSFLYITECLTAMKKLMDSSASTPLISDLKK